MYAPNFIVILSNCHSFSNLQQSPPWSREDFSLAKTDYNLLKTQVTVPFSNIFFFSTRLLQDIEYSSLCYTVGPCHLSILYTEVCIC